MPAVDGAVSVVDSLLVPEAASAPTGFADGLVSTSVSELVIVASVERYQRSCVDADPPAPAQELGELLDVKSGEVDTRGLSASSAPESQVPRARQIPPCLPPIIPRSDNRVRNTQQKGDTRTFLKTGTLMPDNTSRLDGGGTSEDDILQADNDGDRVEGDGGHDQ